MRVEVEGVEGVNGVDKYVVIAIHNRPLPHHSAHVFCLLLQ